MARSGAGDLVPAIWLPDPAIRRERELARFRSTWSASHDAEEPYSRDAGHLGHPCPVSDLFGLAGRELLDRLAIPDPWRRNVDVSLGSMDDLELQIARLTVELNRLGADHRYIPLLITGPGVRLDQRVHRRLAIASIERFASPAKLCGTPGCAHA